IIKGVNVFPSQIESVLINNGCQPNYQLIVDRVNNSDTLDINVEMTPDMFSDKISSVEFKEKAIISDLKKVLGIYAKV
ncbi:MAG: phenylacetate--CoA ligase, partial [Clostridiales bacterium]